MTAKASYPWPQAVLAGLLGLALMLVPFGHRAAAGHDDPALQAYVALGGSLSDLCGSDRSQHADRGCEACRLSASLALPPVPAGAVAVDARPLAVLSRASAAIPRGERHPPAPPVRAPPLG